MNLKSSFYFVLEVLLKITIINYQLGNKTIVAKFNRKKFDEMANRVHFFKLNDNLMIMIVTVWLNMIFPCQNFARVNLPSFTPHGIQGIILNDSSYSYIHVI